MAIDFELKQEELNLNFSIGSAEQIYLLPVGYRKSPDSTSYSESSISFIKGLKKRVPATFISSPESLVELRDANWFGPILLITAQVYSQNPDICQFIIDSVRDSLSGLIDRQNKARINLELVCETKADSRMVSVKYEGDEANLDKLLATFRSVMDNEQKNN
ncbi:hypothetical protein C3D70_12960 [Cronobacter sakazakii]|uniref:hypothetical protein n=1 Tax=Cronobacter sakazakii TaxID=28141 RepID=UPI000CF1384A|nr:hypothetical protein [Cronobacter sakazakii]PPX83804.1 hypothetical protein C3D70_12960 [Cronobacter sakazakii]